MPDNDPGRDPVRGSWPVTPLDSLILVDDLSTAVHPRPDKNAGSAGGTRARSRQTRTTKPRAGGSRTGHPHGTHSGGSAPVAHAPVTQNHHGEVLAGGAWVGDPKRYHAGSKASKHHGALPPYYQTDYGKIDITIEPDGTPTITSDWNPYASSHVDGTGRVVPGPGTPPPRNAYAPIQGTFHKKIDENSPQWGYPPWEKAPRSGKARHVHTGPVSVHHSGGSHPAHHVHPPHVRQYHGGLGHTSARRRPISTSAVPPLRSSSPTQGARR